MQKRAQKMQKHGTIDTEKDTYLQQKNLNKKTEKNHVISYGNGCIK